MTAEARRVAVIGAGISGLTAAYLLQRQCHVTIFEAANRLGGHANTHHIAQNSGTVSLDSAFVTYNQHSYPTFSRLLAELCVPTRETTLNMSLRCDECGLEYSGGNGLAGFFPTLAMGVNPRYLSILAQIPMFFRSAHKYLSKENRSTQLTLREFLDSGHYTRYFTQHFVAPLVSAIWGCPPENAGDYPVTFLLEMLEHHGVLSFRHTPGWRTITGGSHTYVDRIARSIANIYLQTPVRALTRAPGVIEIRDQSDAKHLFDAVVVATHPDQALQLLAKPTSAEQQILGSFRYSSNEVALHTDETVLPRFRSAGATWNYVLRSCAQELGTVECSYDMNKLQGLNTQQRYFVTLNAGDLLRKDRIIARVAYEHPLYTPDAIRAQQMLSSLSNESVAYAGAYHGWGFHEDGCRSGVQAARSLGVDWHA
jgi:predicted NAD/FAD-binding protein